jgi:hypothetical protein
MRRIGFAVVLALSLLVPLAVEAQQAGRLADERDRHRVGAHAVARDATGGAGGVEEG